MTGPVISRLAAAPESAITETRLGWLSSWIGGLWRKDREPSETPKVHPGTLEPRFAELMQCLAALNPVTAAVEQRFLEIGGGLEEITRTSAALVHGSERLIRLATGEEGGVGAVQGAIGVLVPPLSFLREFQLESESLNGRLGTFQSQIQATLAIEHVFQRTVEPLRFVQTLFRVESASCEIQVQTMFLALVRDIESVHEQVRGTFSDQFAKLHETEQILDRLIAELAQSIRSQRTMTDARRVEIEASLAKLQDEVAKNKEVDFELGCVSRRISDETGRVVMALQFQDIISQKLQHVREAVTEMAEARQRAAHSQDQAAVASELRFVQQAGRIVAGQVRRVEEELAEAEGKISGGIRSIIDCMAHLDRDCLALKELDSVAVGADGLVQKLLDAFGEVQRITAETAASAGCTHEKIRPVGDTASNVTGLLRRLSREMHLIGLNAQIQAAQVGEGTGLEVLSAHTSRISEATNELSDRVATELDDLQAGLGQVIECFGRLHQEALQQGETLARRCPAETAALHRHRDASIEALRAAADLVRKLDEQARPMLAKACFEDIAGGVLPALRLSVERLSTEAGAMADTLGASDEVTDRATLFVGRYTMSSERDVHMAAVHGRDGSTPGASSQDGNLGFGAGDLDLFDDLPATPVQSAPAPDTGVDLWLEESPQAAVAEISGISSKVSEQASDSKP